MQTAQTEAESPNPVGALSKRALTSARLQTAPTEENRTCTQETAQLQTAPTEGDRPNPVGALSKRAQETAQLQTAPTGKITTATTAYSATAFLYTDPSTAATATVAH